MFGFAKCGTIRKLRGTSYSNVVSHVRSNHPKGYQVLVDEFSAKSTSENNSMKPKSSIVTQYANVFLYRDKKTHISRWIGFVVDGLQPFSVVENLTFRKLSQFDPITRKTLAKPFETSALKSFEVEQPGASSSDRDDVLPLAARALKRRKLQQRTSACYVDTRFVVGASAYYL